MNGSVYTQLISQGTQKTIAASGGEWELAAITDVQFPVQDWSPVLTALHETDAGTIMIDHWVAAELAAFTQNFAGDPVEGALVYLQYGPSQPEFLDLSGEASEGFVWGTVYGTYNDAQGAAFREKYKARFPGTMGLVYSGGGYDTVQMLAAAWRENDPSDFDAVGDAIRGMKYRGTCGLYKFKNDSQSGTSYPNQTDDPEGGGRRICSSRFRVVSIKSLRHRRSTSRSSGKRTGCNWRMTSDKQHLLGCQGINISFGGRPVLRDVDIHVMPGEVVGLVGPNGVGKTSLFEILTGRYRQSSGRVSMGGQDISTMAIHARARLGLARTYQSPVVPTSMPIGEVFRAARFSHKPVMSRFDAEWGARLAKLHKSWDTPAGMLDTFDRRKLLLACLLMRKPKVMLLDEPASGLISSEIDELDLIIRHQADEYGLGVILIEHRLELLSAIADRVVVLDLGEVIASGPPEQVFDDPRVLEAYFEAPADV